MIRSLLMVLCGVFPLLTAESADIRTEAGAVTPTPYVKHLGRHRQILQEIANARGDFDLILIGDSITAGWPRLGHNSYATLAPWKPLNLGISGESTGLVLWRLENGALEGLHPKVAMIMIGTNNLGHFGKEKPEWVANGVAKIVATVRDRLPMTKILLLSIFPRSANALDPIRKRVDATNLLIAKIGDGTQVIHLDIGHHFLSRDGTLSKDVMPDLLHPNAHGYQIWLDAVKPTLDTLMR